MKHALGFLTALLVLVCPAADGKSSDEQIADLLRASHCEGRTGWTDHISSQIQLILAFSSYQKALWDAYDQLKTKEASDTSWVRHLWSSYRSKRLPAASQKAMESATKYRRYLTEFAGEKAVREADDNLKKRTAIPDQQQTNDLS